MLKIKIVIFILYSAFVLRADNINEALVKARAELSSIRQKNNSLINEISVERKSLTSELKGLRNEIQDKRKTSSELRNRNTRLERIINELEEENKEKQYEESELLNSIRERTNDLYTILQSSITSGQYKEEITELRKLISENISPDKEYLSFIFKLVLQEIERNSLTEQFNGEYYNPAGNIQKGKIIRIGQLAAIFNNEEEKYGYLSYVPASNYFYEIQMKPDRFIRRGLKDYFNEYNNGSSISLLPVDITGGGAIEQIRTKKSFMDYIKTGGVIVYPILAIGLISIFIVIERLITLNRLHTKSDKLMPKLIGTIRDGVWDDAEKVCYALPGAASRVCLTGLKHKDMNKRVLEDVLQEAILKELPVLERFLSTLKIFAAIAPLLGLLGTVTGMIGTFDVISIFGTGDPRMMSGGISEALITTKLGLIVAVPILLLHNFLSGRVSHIVNDMEKNAVTLVNLLELRKERND